MAEIIKNIEDFRRWLEIEKGYSPHTLDGYMRDLNEFASLVYTAQILLLQLRANSQRFAHFSDF